MTQLILEVKFPVSSLHSTSYTLAGQCVFLPLRTFSALLLSLPFRCLAQQPQLSIDQISICRLQHLSPITSRSVSFVSILSNNLPKFKHLLFIFLVNANLFFHHTEIKFGNEQFHLAFTSSLYISGLSFLVENSMFTTS